MKPRWSARRGVFDPSGGQVAVVVGVIEGPRHELMGGRPFDGAIPLRSRPSAPRPDPGFAGLSAREDRASFLVI